MRRSLVFFPLSILVLLLFFGVSSAGQFGAPEPVSTPGGLAVGIGYFHDADHWELKSDSKKYGLVQNQMYLQLSSAILKEIEVYIRGGVADLNFDNAFNSGVATGNQNVSGSNPDLNDKQRFFGTIGARGNFAINRWLSIGPAIQASLFSSYSDTASGSVSGTTVNESGRVHGKYEVAAGLFLQDKFTIDDTQTWVRIYAGPFVYWNHAQLDTSMTSPVSTFPSLTGSTTLNQNLNFGGAAGVRLSFRQGFNFELEGQVRQDVSAGAAISYSF